MLLMKQITLFLLTITLFLGCSKNTQPPQLTKIKNVNFTKTSFSNLSGFQEQNYDEFLNNFINNCKSIKGQKIYKNLCQKALHVTDAKLFLINNFTPYSIADKSGKKEGLLTGYYEAQLHASLKESDKYKYPIYATPKDLVVVDLSSIYPELKNYRLRGKIQSNRLVPYYSRKESKFNDLNASVICYCDSKIDRFFLEVQGSGQVILDDNSTMYIGYDNQNGHKYKSIGKYLVKKGEIPLEKISLQSIRKWLSEHPSRIDEVLNYNKSLVFFSKRDKGATGALGLQLREKSSIAVDKKYIPLGNMVYLSSNLGNEKFNKIVFAQDTGGAIKGPIRADLFLGSGDKALNIAGRLKSPLKLWLLVPNYKEAKE
ncbi:MltA domain protein [Sulfurimonas autotrophica DSM 16294]|uniref:peptidoglycan lytic exotransglycosylase n=2 Tax=Sulfurimonas autotrophica TaxID=202747 RepID=E0UU83_SULAO|nr:MltA domain protein [Sulfurimonas autotrophica DSM 16294]